MSRGRSGTIAQHTLRLFPHAELLVHRSERDDYAGLVPRGRLLLHDEPGFPDLIAYCLDRFGNDHVAYLDDDHVSLVCKVGWRARVYVDPEVCAAVVRATAQCALDAGAKLFGFASNAVPATFRPYLPFRFNALIGTMHGVLAEHGLEVDPRLRLTWDVDLCLQSLLKHRILWIDSRWCLTTGFFSNDGGLASARSQAQFEEEWRVLRSKWGHYVRFDSVAAPWSQRRKLGLPATRPMVYFNVPRAQPSFS